MTTAARVIQSDPDILGGTPLFVGTRVPMKTLLDYHIALLESGTGNGEQGTADYERVSESKNVLTNLRSAITAQPPKPEPKLLGKNCGQ
ncbi:MAG: DUF433 domain-containing protein [Limnoraphis robusta]|uniref:DUF433 domain-containing protein n=1 Tax=Limnoraphis robusta CS-951 TaxID=1637645 RepID=A0A0F5YAH9_9CYAN|nr:DUF433 domain-containing protein [Limnoraphis robusta]KKD35210.1 hypothetical protein WN50_26600 [Limnoraphis robusta CS-951]